MKWQTVRPLRGLAFDIENKPGTYGPGDYTHPKVTAIGWQFLDRKKPRSIILERTDPDGMRAATWKFAKAWGDADFVLGHNIRRHDRKLLDGLFMSLGLPLLPRRRMVDTYVDQPKMAGLSRSLENLADRWECPVKKLHLSEYDWERAYDGHPEGLRKMKQRVESDVTISIWLYRALIERGLLRF